MNTVRVKIEIPRGSLVKYEFNKSTNQIEVDRIVSKPYPFNYGFIPGTMWDDGDPLDVMVVGPFELHPGVEMDVVPRALVKMYDDGVSDFKLMCSLPGDAVTDFDLDAAVRFLSTYKEGVRIAGVSREESDLTEALTRSLNRE